MEGLSPPPPQLHGGGRSSSASSSLSSSSSPPSPLPKTKLDLPSPSRPSSSPSSPNRFLSLTRTCTSTRRLLHGHLCILYTRIIFRLIAFNLELKLVALCLLFFAHKCNLASGRRGSTASDKKRSSKQSARARSKSPFRSFRWPSRKPKAEPDTASAGAAAAYSDDEDSVRRDEYGGKTGPSQSAWHNETMLH